LLSAGNSKGAVLSWPSVAGKTYWLARSTNLSAGFNSTVFTNIAATAPTNTKSDPANIPGSAGFYRVGVEQ
jgi:hypothetical protein